MRSTTLRRAAIVGAPILASLATAAVLLGTRPEAQQPAPRAGDKVERQARSCEPIGMQSGRDAKRAYTACTTELSVARLVRESGARNVQVTVTDAPVRDVFSSASVLRVDVRAEFDDPRTAPVDELVGKVARAAGASADAVTIADLRGKPIR